MKDKGNIQRVSCTRKNIPTPEGCGNHAMLIS